MAAWLFAGTLDDVWEGEMCAVDLDGAEVLLCNLDGELFAYEDRCPHLANPLSQGDLSEGVLTCAAHEWQFDARSGHGVNPASVCLHRYPLRLDGDRIFVGVGEDE
ncbi:Rieske (2Fe-2S) protein [Pseudonocardia acidicola]|uniref:Rieske (2Fe-2S) protein n=1 Tax=Pseudonocardia acidicola TaxID=2724939 RepID=UPI0030845E07